MADQLKNTTYNVIFTSRDQIDISDFEESKIKIIHIAPDVVINASAYTAVDKAEEDQVTADLINHLAVNNLAAISLELGCWLIHISTDYVFDGNSTVPYCELDKTNPQGVYGHTKLNGELAIQSSGCKYLIIRTAWVFSEYGNNFLKTMVRLGTVRDELSIVGDQIGCPTYAQDIAKAIMTMVIQLNEERSASGIFHYCGDQPCSWYDFARVIFEEASFSGFKTPGFIRSVQTSDYPTAAARPVHSSLECHKIRNSFGVSPSDWKLGVKNVISKIDLMKF
ncbi:dTDP-4-dehydrorhamnose reductase [Candidatus Njordibacter sp. Uisw_002]|uniref:dTDP-4-dehydrorhamnose reductase n=1 Tax=Candidatus Njordibacter sp. Uisw_002 TaxID=3230971 RepID=UPI003D48E974